MSPAPDRQDHPDADQARESFARFYAEHRSLVLIVLRVALSGTGVDPHDIASHTWIKIWERWRQSGPMVEAPKAYMRQCARRAAIDALRIQTDLLLETDELDRLSAHQQTTTPGVQPQHITPQRQPQCAVRDLLTDPRLIAAVHELTPIERLVILISIDTSPPPTSTQIAQILNIASASTVRGHRMRAMRKLRDIFDTLDSGKGGTSR